MTNMGWSIVLASLGLLGLYLAGSKNYWGWMVSFTAQGAWIIYAVVSQQYGFILSAIAYGIVYGRNFTKWVNEQEEPP